MYPIPRHLVEIFNVNTEESSEYDIKGKISCTCGCDKFGIRTYAEYDKEGCPHVYEYKGDYAFVVKCICKDCQKEWLLFDLSKHGFEGFLWHEGAEVPDSELEKYHCLKCNSEYLEIIVEIEAEDKEQFIEEVVELEPDKYTEEDYVDAFNWITIDLKCAECGEEFKNWVSLELS